MIDEEAIRQISHSLSLIQSDIKAIRTELQHNRELCEQRLNSLEKLGADHETRLRDATNGVTQFRIWSSLSNGGSAVMSLAALIKSFLP